MPPPDRRIIAYRRALHAQARAARLAQAVIDGVALGSFDRAALARLDQSYYDKASEPVAGAARPFGDELSIRQGLFDWEREAIEDLFPPRGRVVVTAAGAGREVLALCEMGYDAYGFEPHPQLAAAGDATLSKLGYPGRLSVCERDVWPREATAADAVVIGWTSYTLTPGRRRRVALLSGARGVLPHGGPVLLSFGLRNRFKRDLAIVRAIGGAVRRARREEPLEYGDWLAGDARTPLFVHLFTETELRGELGSAGFALERFRSVPYAHGVARATG